MTSAGDEGSDLLAGRRVIFAGRLASMARREATALARRHGAQVAEAGGMTPDLVVVGEADLPLGPSGEIAPELDGSTREAVEAGRCEVLPESQFWRQLGLVDDHHDIQRLYTPAMLAELVGVSVAVVRRWHRRGLIVPAREVRRLPYFDYQEVVTARRLAGLLAAGIKPQALERKLAALARFLPHAERPLAQLSIILRDKELLLRQEGGLLEPGGQLRFDFEAFEAETGPVLEAAATPAAPAESPPHPAELCQLAAELEEEGKLEAAAEIYRAAMAAGGPNPEICFQVGEILYRLGEPAAARERYYMAIELDENYVEARANLGCVLAELGQRELAVAAFEGALAFHPDYADAHYQLARTLDDLGQDQRAGEHWRAFLDLAPNSPWADEARARLG